MVEDAKALRAKSELLAELNKASIPQTSAPSRPGGRGFKTFGDFLSALHAATFGKQMDSRLNWKTFEGEGEAGAMPKTQNAAVWADQKDLVESTGAQGGFLVPTEFRPETMMLLPFQQYVRSRALVIPMTRRQVTIPTLDQTGTTTGVSNFYGGVVPKWTEEGAYKDETEPKFRQMELIAHELVVYTEASDILLEDSAISLEQLLTRLFGDAISNEEEWTFINGTGAGQPLGVVQAGATFHQPRTAAGQINILDIFNMLGSFIGVSPVWIAHQSTLPQILGLNGPAGNPSYVFISNARESPGTTLMGYPVYFTENCPTLGAAGDIILADWSKYIVGDRKATTIDSSKHYRFRYDLTAWRAVHRVDGRPWLSAPLTLRDGATQVSPFVILDDQTS
jgi:HK97 family phage major capsid protein